MGDFVRQTTRQRAAGLDKRIVSRVEAIDFFSRFCCCINYQLVTILKKL